MKNKSWISEYVDKIFLINLAHRKDRLQESISELIRVGIVNDVEQFEAIEHETGIIGCTQSHYELVKHAKAKAIMANTFIVYKTYKKTLTKSVRINVINIDDLNANLYDFLKVFAINQQTYILHLLLF